MRTCRGFAQSSRCGAAAGVAGAIVAGVILCFAAGAAPAQTSQKQTSQKPASQKQASQKQASQKQASVKQGSPKQGTVKRGSPKQESPKQESLKQESRKQAAPKHEPPKQEPSKQETSKQDPLKFAGSQLEPLKWSELSGWASDDHLAAFAAYQAGCRAARRRPRTDDHAQISGALGNVCRKALSLQPQNSDAARAFFEQNFQPVRIARLGEGGGLVTGYYEPIVAGSRFPSPEFSVPIYRRPRDLVADGYKQGSTAFPNKGGRIGRRTEGNDLVPYHDRAAIEAGALDGQKLEICWIKDPLDLVAIQIEGSARVILEDGTPLRISYDSHNGYSYSSIERALVERNLMSRQEISRERIRAWMVAHPEEAAKVRAVNRAYMFFRITGLTNDGEPVGAQGVPLTPGRSIAVDRVHEYGTPFFIEGNLPIESAQPAAPLGRLTIAQDTGSAIVGPARADLYLGAGDEAGRIAGRIKHRGRFSMLVPRELDLAAAASELPLPVPKPKIAESDGEKSDAKQDGKGKAEPAGPGTPAPGKPMPSPLAKTRIAAFDVGKPERNGKAEPAGATTDGRHMPSLPPKTKVAVAESKKLDRKGKMDSDNAAWTVAGKQKPSSAAKTKIAETEGRKETGKHDGKSKAEPAKSGMTATGKPSSGPKPKIAETEAKKDISKHDAKGKAEAAGSGKIAAGKPSPPAPKLKNAEAEAKKQNGKGKAESTNSNADGKAAAKPGRQAASARKSDRSLY
jgi:membrane-bound lytic murein transglycosylase A